MPKKLPAWFRANLSCTCHQGAPGHDVEHCYALKNALQDLIQANILSFEGQPQVQQRPKKQLLCIQLPRQQARHQFTPQDQAPRTLQFDLIPMKYAELLPLLFEKNLVQTIVPPPVPKRLPVRWRPGLSCAFHHGAQGHDVLHSVFQDQSPKVDRSQSLVFQRLGSKRTRLVLRNMDWLAIFGSLLMFLLPLIYLNNVFVCCFYVFQNKILLSRPRRKWTCVGLFALCIVIINKKSFWSLLCVYFILCSSGKNGNTKNLKKTIITFKYLHTIIHFLKRKCRLNIDKPIEHINLVLSPKF